MSDTKSFMSTDSSSSTDSSPVTPAQDFLAPSDVLVNFYSYANFASGRPIPFHVLDRSLAAEAPPLPVRAPIRAPVRVKKRRNSDLNSVGLKLSTHFPSLGKRLLHHKNSSVSAQNQSSRTSSCCSPVAKEGTANSSLSSLIDPSPVEWPFEYVAVAEEPIDRRGLASTPLLPPKIGELAKSLLPSPDFGDPCPQTLSQHYEGYVPIDGLCLNIPQDKWSRALGHANFSIQPEPYVPENPTGRSWIRLERDWENAQAEYLRHQARTLEHYGHRSKTYELTQEKWADIKARWERCIDEATARYTRHRAAMGLSPPPPPFGSQRDDSAGACAATDDSRPSTAHSTPSRPGTAGKDVSPARQMPFQAPSWDRSKFPTLGDADIVGPMMMLHGASSGSDSEPSPVSDAFVPAAAVVAAALPAAVAAPPAQTSVAARIGGVVARKASSSRLFRDFGKLFTGRGEGNERKT
jgi:hypothetical protein